MKLNRKTLRKLILEAVNESQIKPSIPGLGDAEYDKMQTMARHEDPEFRTQASTLASSLGYDGDFAGDLGRYDSPSAFETVMIYHDQGREKRVVEIPRDLVDGLLDAFDRLKAADNFDHGAQTAFRDAALRIHDHIEKEIHPHTVFEGGLEVGGYRADEYETAMFVVGDYL